MCSSIFGPGTDFILLLILWLLLLLWTTCPNSLRLLRFKSYREEIWLDCSSSTCRPIYASIDGVWFSIWRHTFTMVVMASFHAEKCCHLVSTHVVHQFLIHSTFVSLVCLDPDRQSDAYVVTVQWLWNIRSLTVNIKSCVSLRCFVRTRVDCRW